ELDRRRGGQRLLGDLLHDEDDARVQRQLPLGDLRDVRHRVRDPRDPDRPGDHVAVEASGGEAMSSSVLFDAPGPRARRMIVGGNVLAAVVALAVVAWVLIQLGAKGQLAGNLWADVFTARTWQYYLLPGLQNTLRAAAFAIVGAIVFGLVFGVGRLSQVGPVRWLSGLVVEFLRAVPVLLMMVFFYGLFGQLFRGSDDNAFLAVVVALV